MMENDMKREFRWFMLTDYEKEETFLREMHNKGYKLVKVKLPGFYYFEICEPEDVVYKLDFNPQTSEDKQSYLQMYADYGWEYMQDINEYSYFRKSAGNTDEGDTNIFSDDQSKLDMLKRIFMKKLVPHLAIFLLFIVCSAVSLALGGIESSWNRGFIIFWSILFLIYLVIFVYCGSGFYKLRKNYSHRVE